MRNWKKAQSIVGTNKGKNHGIARPDDDFYPTPPEGTWGLLKVETFDGAIWEPACGNGAMSIVLIENGYTVISSDIHPRGYGSQANFLSCNELLAPNIVTNPPFILAQKFAEHAFDLGCSKLALLCKLAFLETQKRCDWLEHSPLKGVYVFKHRLSLYREGVKLENGGMLAFAWFIWDRHYIGRPTLGWI